MIGERVRELRENHSILLRQLAAKLEMDTAMLSKLDFGDVETAANRSETLDVSFRVYRLDSSNMLDVYYRPQDYIQEALDLFEDNVKPDRTPDDLLAQVMLDWGLPLSLKIEQAGVLGKRLFKVAANSLFACFDEALMKTSPGKSPKKNHFV